MILPFALMLLIVPATDAPSVAECVLRDGIDHYFSAARHDDLGKLLLVADTRPTDASIHTTISDRTPPESRGALARSFRDSADVRPSIPALASHKPAQAAKEDLMSGNRYDWPKIRSTYPSVEAILEVSEPALTPDEDWAVVRLVRRGLTSAIEYNILLQKSDRGQWIMRAASADSLK